jgi:hypothetical protein
MFRVTLIIQTAYYLVTAIWPLVHIQSFMAVSGPKTDIWLVKTVAVLLVAISLCFITHLLFTGNRWPVSILAISCCLGFLFIDCYYSFNGVISSIYLLDAGAQIILLALWMVIIIRLSKRGERV